MASELTVQTLRGPASGANANKILIADGHSIEGVGGVVQATQAEISGQVQVNSATFTDIGSHAITPTSSTSKVKFTCNLSYHASGTSGYSWLGFRILRGSTVIYDSHRDTNGPYGSGVNAGTGGNVAFSANHFLLYLDSPATTSSVTYKVQGATYNSSVTLQAQHNVSPQSGKSVIILEEIAG